jgi:hypothetical protein
LTCNFIKESHSEKAPLNGQVHVHIISISLAHSKTTMVLLQNHGLSVKIYIMIALIRRLSNKNPNRNPRLTHVLP